MSDQLLTAMTLLGKPPDWYLRGLQACSAVARIGENTQHGFGTGFLLHGGQISKDLSGQLVLLTNAHIVSDDPNTNNGSLKINRAVATLEAAGKDLELRFSEAIRTSSINELDITVLKFDDATAEKLKTVNIPETPIAQTLPQANGSRHVYIIGYPHGGSLNILTQKENILLASNDDRIHYHAPTEYGSSGSPVFNENWELIAIHHAGGPDTPRLDDPRLTYDAAEGIRISAIQRLFETS